MRFCIFDVMDYVLLHELYGQGYAYLHSLSTSLLSGLQKGIIGCMDSDKGNVQNFDRFTAAYVRELADEREFTQTKLAEVTGIEQYRLSRAFGGGKPFTFEEMRALAGAFNMPLSRLAGEIDEAFRERFERR